jgi:hypothetical protein
MASEEDDLDPLEDLEDEDEERTTLVRRLRARIKDGKAAGRDEEQRDQAWQATSIPARVRALMGDVDERDPDALAAKVAELQADGLRWGDEAAAITAKVEQEARSATLDRMSSLAAGGSVPNAEDDKANRIKARIDSGQEVPDADLSWFWQHVGGAHEAITTAKRIGW